MSTREIMGRVSELTFNASLLSELRAVEFVGKLIDQERLPRGTGGANSGVCGCIASRWRSRAARSTPAASSTPTSSSSRALHKLGQRATRRFLDAHFDDIGRRSTIGMEAEAHAEVA